MKIMIADPDLDFLSGGSLVLARYPVRVMRTAIQRVDLLRAIPTFEHIRSWRAFKFEQDGPTTGSITVVDGWRMDIRGTDGNETRDQITILRIRNAKS